MNSWDRTRNLNKWGNGLVEWVSDNTVYLSVVFSWRVQDAINNAISWKNLGYKVFVGGPAVMLNPARFDGIAEVGECCDDALLHHSTRATFTSRGCVRKCSFCIVPKIEGDLVELKEWLPKPVVCDNNLLACSRRHFDLVVDKLKQIRNVDFNQGLDARLLSLYHADRLAELNLRCVRLAWDNIAYENDFVRAYEILRRVGIAKSKIWIYILIGFMDCPDDALYRLNLVREIGCKTLPMRYQPIDTERKNSYIGKNWQEKDLQRFMRYWSNDRLRKIPFSEFSECGHEPQKTARQQLRLWM